MTGAAQLSAWLRSRAQLAGRVVAPEEALLSGRFARYAARRLGAFLFSRGWNTALHVLELTWLAEVFSARAFVASLALQNLSLVLDAGYWGALEGMRRRMRSLGRGSEAASHLTHWLTAALWAGLLIAVVPMTRAAWGLFVHNETPSMLHVYALVCALRLGADVILRTYYSGVYAYRRVYRPIWSLFLAPGVLFLGTVLFWRAAGGWSFPIALVASVILSRGLLFHFSRRAYRQQRTPEPLWRFGVRAWSVSGAVVREAALASLANLGTRLGSIVLLAAVVPSLSSVTWDEADEPTIAPFALALHVSTPLLLLASQWGIVFYHDWKRLEDEGASLLARRLERRLLGVAVVLGLVAWASTAALSRVFVPFEDSHDTLLALLPAMLGISLWTAIQLRGFARGEFVRQAASAMAMLLVLWVAISGTWAGPTTWYLALAAGPWSAIALGLLLGRWSDHRATGLVPSAARWMRALRGHRRELVVWRARANHDARVVALRIADALGSSGAVLQLRDQVFWFEELATARRRSGWVALGAGTLTRLDRLGEGAGRGLAPRLQEEHLLPGATADVSAALERSHAARFPGGFAVRVGAAPPAAFLALEASVRQSLWTDALRDQRVARGGGRSGWFVTAHAPQGILEVFFVAPKPVDPRTASEWRAELRLHTWRPTDVQRG